jgi:hypothetical protein
MTQVLIWYSNLKREEDAVKKKYVQPHHKTDGEEKAQYKDRSFYARFQLSYF